MSLDVYLIDESAEPQDPQKRIYIREDGRTKEISREEWDQRFPGREPVTWKDEGNRGIVFEWNITHNLNTMAEAAGLYEVLWRPDEIGLTKAKELIPRLSAGLVTLQREPDRFKALNPKNGWGTYENLVEFVEAYLNAAKEHPEATVQVSR